MMTIWLAGGIVFGAMTLMMVLVSLGLGGNLEWKSISYIVFISAIWPIAIFIGLGNVVYQGIRRR